MGNCISKWIITSKNSVTNYLGIVCNVMKWNFDRFFRIIYSILRIIFVLVNNLYCIPTYVVWCCIFHPVYYINPDLYWYYEGVFFDWLLTMVAFWSYSAGYRSEC